MKLFRKYLALRRTLAVTMAGLFLQACYRWSARPLTPQTLPELGPDRHYRVTLIGGFQTLIEHPFISGDSLLWFSKRPGTRGGAGDLQIREGVPLTQVRNVEVQTIDPVGTTLLVFAAIGMTAAIVAAANGSTGSAGGSSGSSSSGGGYCDYCASCPLVYSWDGTDWRLDSGTFGGAIVQALERTDVDNLDVAVPVDGRLRLKAANHLNETDYLDAVTVLAVDHDPDVSVAPDGAGGLHTVGVLVPPVTARDFGGHDVLSRVRARDAWNWESYPAERDTAALADVRDGLEVSFARPRDVATAQLLVDGNNTVWAVKVLRDFIAAHGTGTEAWYDSLNAAPQRARALMQGIAREGFLGVSVWAGGRWEPQGYLWDVGPEIAKRQVIPLDLTRVVGDTVRVRLESAPSFWQLDQVALDFSPQRSMAVTELALAQGVDGRGRDLRALLRDVDQRVLTLETGDSALLEVAVPPVPTGRARSYLLKSTGWYRIHTPMVGEPATSLLARLQSEPFAASKHSVASMNEMLGKLRLDAGVGGGR